MTVALVINHNFVCPVSDDADPNTVSPSHWNDTHGITGVAQINTELLAKADKTTTVTAGAGLTGGGDLSANRTLDVGGSTSIIVGTDDVQRAALTGDITAAQNVNATAIAVNVVDNTKLADMVQATIKGRASGAGTGDPTDLSGAQVLAITGAQAGDATLTALAAYNTNGLLTQTAADTFAGRAITGTANQITVTDGNGVAGNPTLALNPTDIIVPAILTVPNVGLHLLDTNATHDLIVKPGSDLTLDRTFTLTTGDANRTLTINADTTLGGGTHSGTNTGDQTLAGLGGVATTVTLTAGAGLTGGGDLSANRTFDVIGSTSIIVGADDVQRAALTGDVTAAQNVNATVIANNAVSNAKLADVNSATFKGRITAAAGDPEDLTGTQATTLLDVFTSTLKGLVPGGSGGSTVNYLRADGTWQTPPNQAITLTGDVTGSGTGSFATAIAANAVTNVELADVPTATFKGRTTAATGDPEDLTVAQAKTLLNLAGTNSGDQTLGGLGGQPVDATLTALAAYNANGLMTQTAADTFAGRTITATATQITVTNGDGVAGNPALSFPADIIVPTVLTVPNSGLHVLDTDASHDLIIKPGSNLTLDRILTITTGDAARTLTMTGDTSLGGGTHSGTNTGDQTITLTGDVTGSGTGSFATTIVANAVTNTELADVPTATFKGRTTALTGDPEDLTVAQAKTLLNLTGTNSGDQTLGSLGAQAADATLTALAAFNTNGLLTQTAADTFAGRTITATATQITVTNGDGVAGNPALSFPADIIVPTVLTVPNSGLHLLDTNATHDLIIKPGSDLTLDRILTITTGDAARTLTFTADATIGGTTSGTNTGDQTLGGLGGQPLDATLTALAALDTTAGVLAQTGTDTFAKRTITGTTNQIAVANGTGASANPTLSLDATDIIVPAIITAPNSGLHILDTNASHDLIIKPGSDLTLDRIFTLTTGDAARTLTINADTTLGGGSHSGTNTGDQAAGGGLTGTTTLAVGAGTGITVNADDVALNLAATLTWSGVTTFSNATTATTTTAAAVIVTGGVGVGENVLAGGSVFGIAGIGYPRGGYGTGGAVTQLTSKATAVTLDRVCGLITTHNAALAADTLVSFTFNNTKLSGATDMIIIVPGDAATQGKYHISASVFTTGQATIFIRNITAGSLSEAIIIQFAIFRASQN